MLRRDQDDALDVTPEDRSNGVFGRLRRDHRRYAVSLRSPAPRRRSRESQAPRLPMTPSAWSVRDQRFLPHGTPTTLSLVVDRQTGSGQDPCTSAGTAIGFGHERRFECDLATNPRDSETTYVELSAAGMTEPAKSLAVVLSARREPQDARNALTAMLPDRRGSSSWGA